MENERLKQAFQKMHHLIVSDVTAASPIDILFAEKVISNDDYGYLLSKNGTRQEQCRELLYLLHSANRPDAFVQLRIALMQDDTYKYLVEQLDQHYSECGQAPETDTLSSKNIADICESSVKRNSPRRDLSEMLSCLLCVGKTEITSEIHPILVISRPDACLTNNKLNDCFKFLSFVPWRAVFDFDNAENDNSVYRFMDEDMKKVYVVATVDIFDYNIKDNEEEKKRVQDSIRKEDQTVWFFANGYNDTGRKTLQLREWTRQYSEGFNEALTLFSKEVVPQGRALIVFLLLSSDDEVMTAAAESVCLKFKKCWLTLAETDEIADRWKRQLLQKVTDEEELNERCVIGLPWEQVNDTIIRLYDDNIASSCQLTTSTGAEVNWSTKAKNDCAQLEVLGCNECANMEMVADRSRIDELRHYMDDVQQQFYRGHQVSWWNFFFPDQVLQRDLYSTIFQRVSSALDQKTRYKDQVVEKIKICHQPSAGGTTIAKQIMWELRNKYRCAVVKKITDAVYDQIFMFYSYKDEKNPRPVLLLLDDYTDEAVNEFVVKLVDMARKKPRHPDAKTSFFFVLIVCKSSPKPIDETATVDTQSQFFLKAALSSRELLWAENKYKTCEAKYLKRLTGGINRKQINHLFDPQNFISFNVMKSNFNESYMREVVRKYTENIASPAERQLLKYVSLISRFGIGKLDIPLSSFDLLMRQPRWEISISEPLQVLLNDDPRRRECSRREVRIINRALSKYVYEDLTAETKQLESGVILELLDSGIFITSNDTVDQLLGIIRNLMKNREKELVRGQYRDQYFSPLIETIFKDGKQHVTSASEVLKRVFDLTHDLFVGQQIARLYIKVKNWEAAVEYGKIITERKDSSYLLDTLGQAYKRQLDVFYWESKKSLEGASNSVTAKRAEEMLKIAFLAIDTFQQGQQVSTLEKITDAINNSVHFNEVKAVETLFGLLSYVEGLRDPNTLTKFLVVKEFEPESVKCWHPDSKTRIKEIVKSVKTTLSLLTDDYLQRPMKSDFNDDYPDSRQGRAYLLKLKASITSFLVPHIDDVPEGLSKREVSEFYRGRIERLGGDTLLGLVTMRNDVKNEEKLENTLAQILKYAEKNIDSAYTTAFDYKVYVGTGMIYCTLPGKLQKLKLTHSVMADHSALLYQMSMSPTATELEPYLFAVMLNWPRDNANFSPKIPAHELKTIMGEWKKAFDRKYPRRDAEKKKRETTYFFLAQGDEMDAFAYSGEFGAKAADDFFNDDQVKERLEKRDGVLLWKHGTSRVNVTIKQDGNKYEIDIPTSYPLKDLKDGTLYNKKVTFYLGFQWSGPKAYGIAKLSSDEEERQENAASYCTAKDQVQFDIGDESQFPNISSSRISKRADDASHGRDRSVKSSPSDAQYAIRGEKK